MAIIKLVDNIFNASNDNETTAGVFLDLCKAFANIRHGILFFRENGTLWLQRHCLEMVQQFSNRKQFVDYNKQQK